MRFLLALYRVSIFVGSVDRKLTKHSRHKIKRQRKLFLSWKSRVQQGAELVFCFVLFFFFFFLPISCLCWPFLRSSAFCKHQSPPSPYKRIAKVVSSWFFFFHVAFLIYLCHLCSSWRGSARNEKCGAGKLESNRQYVSQGVTD